MARQTKAKSPETFTAEDTKVRSVAACLIAFGGEKYKFEDEFTIPASELLKPGVLYLFSQGMIEVVDNYELNKQIVEFANAKKKRDPREGKTREQLEEGGEIK